MQLGGMMQHSRLARRLAFLEAQHSNAEACGIRLGESTEVEVYGTAERMTVDEFARRYPNGIIIRWHEADDEPL
jgi:hypothetical protein